MNITEIYCDVDDFCQVFLPAWFSSLLDGEQPKRKRKLTLSPSEVMTLLMVFHGSSYRHFKSDYTPYVPLVLGREFPHRVSYNRLVELAQSVLIPLCAYLQTRRVSSRGIAFVDSTPLRVCQNRRIPRHQTVNNLAQRGKTSVDWCYGFKRHLIIDDRGELIAFLVTPGHYDDRKGLKKMAPYLKGKLFADKGYISTALGEELWEPGIELITKLRRNMKKVVLADLDKILLRKRALIETVNDQLKNISQLEHTRHRSLTGFMVKVIGALIAYSWQSKKPSLQLRTRQSMNLVVVDEDNTTLALSLA